MLKYFKHILPCRHLDISSKKEYKKTYKLQENNNLSSLGGTCWSELASNP